MPSLSLLVGSSLLLGVSVPSTSSLAVYTANLDNIECMIGIYFGSDKKRKIKCIRLNLGFLVST